MDLWDISTNVVGMRLRHSSTNQGGQFALSVRLNVDPTVPSLTVTDSPVVDSLYRPLDNWAYSVNGINAPMGTRFDLEVEFTTANNGNRVGPGDFANWTVTGTGLTSYRFWSTASVGAPWYSVVRILGIPPQGGSSWVSADPVPEPGTILA